MKRLCISLGLATSLLSAASMTHATVNWTWTFIQDTVNLALAQTTDVYVTVSNLATSDESIQFSHLDYESFGDYGIFVDPATGVRIIPASQISWNVIAPGQSSTYRVMTFYFGLSDSGHSRPSSDFVQTFLPSMIAGSCGAPYQCGVSQLAAAPLTLIYAPVPEPATWGLWMGGLAVGASLARRRRA